MKFINFFKTHQTISAIILATVMFFGTFLIFNAAAFAQNVTITGDVQHHYKIVIDRQPYNVEICQKGNQSGASAGDLLSGAIIGGAIGNNIKGEEGGGAIGAVLGAMAGHANSDATGGTRRVCNIETRYKEEIMTVYSHSVVSFAHEGREYQLKFQK